MTNELVVRQERGITPPVWQMLASIAESSSVSRVEQKKIVKHLLFCYENELPLSLAVNGGLYTVNNRVEVEGTVIRAQIRKHPRYDYRIDKLSNSGCIMTVLRDGEEIGEASFLEADAKAAGLLDKAGPWKQYPIDMYLNRATSRAYKRYCPDIFFQSVYVRGEIADDPVIIEQYTMQSLSDRYGSARVLEAMQHSSDVESMAMWLEENDNGSS